MPNESIRKTFSRIFSETKSGRSADRIFEADGNIYTRRFVPEDRLIILGGGHIAKSLCRMASMLDFSVTVVDDRPAFANAERFPEASCVICDSFENAISKLGVRNTDYVCIVTRGHRWDGVCLRALIAGEEPYYTGMIGSRRRVAALLDLLRDEGCDPLRLEAVHTPIGLKIGAETPAEISVSICAEMILERRSHKSEKEENGTVLERTETDFSLLSFLAEGTEPCAVMTVISTKGSTPADSGSIMATDRAGRIYGTIGGGCGEAEAISAARRLIGTGGTRILDISMTNDVAADEGMACGGSMRVFVEDVAGGER